jgi:hypothetical protein
VGGVWPGAAGGGVGGLLLVSCGWGVRLWGGRVVGERGRHVER